MDVRKGRSTLIGGQLTNHKTNTRQSNHDNGSLERQVNHDASSAHIRDQLANRDGEKISVDE